MVTRDWISAWTYRLKFRPFSETMSMFAGTVPEGLALTRARETLLKQRSDSKSMEMLSESGTS